MVKEFKDFIMRGNVVDLAVGVIIGAAFTAVVNSLVRNIFTPILGVIGSTDFKDLKITLRHGTPAVQLLYGQFITDVISFLLIAVAVFFFVVKPMNMLAARRARGEEPEDETELSDEALLLTEIRDILSTGANANDVG
jgi:large conductance mechanosensitive channel